MAFVLCLCILLAIYSLVPAHPLGESREVITDYQFDRDEKGGYSFSFDSSDGIHRDETGNITKEGGTSVSGSFRFFTTDGAFVAVRYSADEKGFRPSFGIREDAKPKISPAGIAGIQGGGIG